MMSRLIARLTNRERKQRTESLTRALREQADLALKQESYLRSTARSGVDIHDRLGMVIDRIRADDIAPLPRIWDERTGGDA